MEIIVKQDISPDGVISIKVVCNGRCEYSVSLGSKETKPVEDSIEWAQGLAGLYIKHLLIQETTVDEETENN